MKKNKDIAKILIVVSLILCLLSAIGSNLILTNGRQVKVTNIRISTAVGELTGYMYVPKEASTENQLPAMVISHGSNSSAESVQSWSLELARRGYVVFSPNMYAHGDSPVVDSKYEETISYTTNGLYDAVEEGKIYVSEETGYSCSMWNPNEIHNINLLSKDCTSSMVDFLNHVMPAANSAMEGQIWGFKLVFDFLGVVGFFMFILPCIYLLLRLPGFNTLTENKVRSFPALVGDKKKKYIRSVVTGALLNTVLLLPYVVIGGNLFTNVIFPQSTTNSFAFWGVVSGLFTFLFVRRGTGKKIFKNKKEFGLVITKEDLVKVISVALIAVAATYSLVFMAQYFFNSTFQCWTYIIRAFDKTRFLQMLRYLPLFGIQQLASSIATSRNNFENWSDGKRIAFSTTLALIPVVLIMAITYVPILFTGSPMWGMDGSNLVLLTMGSGSTRVFNFLFSMATISFINVKTQKLTGSVWLGAIVNTLLITITSAVGCATAFNF